MLDYQLQRILDTKGDSHNYEREEIEEVVLDELKCIFRLALASGMVTDELERKYKYLLTHFDYTNTWTELFSSEEEFLAFLREMTIQRDTIKSKMARKMLRNGVDRDKVLEEILYICYEFNLSTIDLEFRQLTAQL